MAITLGQGFAPYMLNSLKDVALQSNPNDKLEPTGFLAMLMNQTTRPDVLKLNKRSGHQKSVSIKYRPRPTIAQTQTSKDCNIVHVQDYLEADVDLSAIRQYGFHIDDETIAKYLEEASVQRSVGTPPTPLMNELFIRFLEAGTALMQGLDQDLLTDAIPLLGKNVKTATDLTVASDNINIELDTNNNPLSSGLTELLSQYKVTGGLGRPQIVGDGLFLNFTMQQPAKSTAQDGVNTAIQAAQYDFYHDENASSIVGIDEILVYQPNAIQPVEYLEYTGFKAGWPGAGDSLFGTIALPMASLNGAVKPIMFDWQLKYSSCETTVENAIGGGALVVQKGWTMLVSKQMGLFAIPDDAYLTADRLFESRGALRYDITNT